MIENFNQYLGAVTQTELAKATRRSARTVWNAHRAALETTREEAGKVIGLAIHEGQKLDARRRKTVTSVVEDLTGAADERLSSLEHAFQQRVLRVIRRMGLPTASDVEALARRVDALSSRVSARKARKPARRKTRRAA